jgi:phosphinothricin acetyltransferase
MILFLSLAELKPCPKMAGPDRWNIHLAQREETAEILNIYAPFILETAVSFELEVPSVEAYWSRIEGVIREAPWIVCSFNDKVTGFAYAGRHRIREAYRFTREVSAYVHPDFRRNRIATALYTALFEVLKAQGFACLLAGITQPNPASTRFHRSMGFSKIGEYRNVGYKFNKFHTVDWWELSINENIDGKILSTDEIMKSEAWEEAIKQALTIIK